MHQSMMIVTTDPHHRQNAVNARVEYRPPPPRILRIFANPMSRLEPEQTIVYGTVVKRPSTRTAPPVEEEEAELPVTVPPPGAKTVKIAQHDGTTFQGPVLEETDKAVTILVNGRPIRIQRLWIKEMKKVD